jgi:hypothetical protein
MDVRRSRPSFVISVTLIVGATLAITGCATVFTGTSDDIQFETEPSGATVIVDGLERGETPTTITVDRSINDKRVTIEKEGYEEREIRLRDDFNTVSILNFGNLLFWGIDLATGAIYRYNPQQYDIDLEEESSSSASASQRIVEEKYGTYTTVALRDAPAGEMVLSEPHNDQGVILKDSDRDVVYVFE